MTLLCRGCNKAYGRQCDYSRHERRCKVLLETRRQIAKRQKARQYSSASRASSSVMSRSSSPFLRASGSAPHTSSSRDASPSPTPPPVEDNELLSSSDEEKSGRKRGKSYAEGREYKKPHKDPFGRAGRHFSRTVDMWRRFEAIIEVGTLPPEEQEAFEHGPVFAELYKELCSIFPRVAEHVTATSIDEVARSLETGRANARGEDIKRLNERVHKLRTFEPALSDDKSARGFHNDQTARLLVPAMKVNDWNFDKNYQIRLKEGREEVNPRDYPIFFYENETIDHANPFKGFLQNDILVRAFRMIFLGPSAVDGCGTSARAMKRGNAMLNNMTHVTIPSIAYIATLVYHVLSSQMTFSVGNQNGKFNYHQLYTSIIDLYKNDKRKRRSQQLLEWWDWQVFNQCEVDRTKDGDSLYARMLEQLEDEDDDEATGIPTAAATLAS